MPKDKELKSKKDIIEKSFALFLEKGYKNVTIINIMEATQLSKGAIYHHFKSKEEIYLATLDRYYFNLLQTETFNDSTGDFRKDIQFLSGFVANLFGSIESIGPGGMNFPIRNFFSYQLESEKNDEIRAKISESVVIYRQVVKNLVLAAKRRKELSEEVDAEILTIHIIGLLEGIAIHHSTEKKDVQNTLNEMYSKVLEPFLNQIIIK